MTFRVCYVCRLSRRRHRSIVVPRSRGLVLGRLIGNCLTKQKYHVSRGNWSMVVFIDIQLHRLRSELYGVGYCGQ